MPHLYTIKFLFKSMFDDGSIKKIITKALEKDCKVLIFKGKETSTNFSIDYTIKKIMSHFQKNENNIMPPANVLLAHYLQTYFRICFDKNEENKLTISISSYLNIKYLTYFDGNVWEDFDWDTYIRFGLMICHDFPIEKIETIVV